MKLLTLDFPRRGFPTLQVTVTVPLSGSLRSHSTGWRTRASVNIKKLKTCTLYRVSIKLYKHEWKFGRTKNAVGTPADKFWALLLNYKWPNKHVFFTFLWLFAIFLIILRWKSNFLQHIASSGLCTNNNVALFMFNNIHDAPPICDNHEGLLFRAYLADMNEVTYQFVLPIAFHVIYHPNVTAPDEVATCSPVRYRVPA